MKTDIHRKSFDDGTLIKLDILREYLKQWLPVFLFRKKIIWKKVFIYDFFAGEGTDVDGNIGSPLITLNELKKYCKRIIDEKIYVKVVFNEFLKKKNKRLNDLCQQHLSDCRNNSPDSICPTKTEDNCVFDLVIENKNFGEFFDEIYQHMLQYPEMPRFMFLDQYGVKHITKDIFIKLINLERTDFIFFISSSFARRFIQNEEFKKYLDLTNQDFNEEKPYHCHRVIFNYYKSLIPSNQEFYLAPFSIKKNQNIYGLIFGTHHTLGIEKFLNVCWKINPNTGDANYDIDGERINLNEPSLFKHYDIPSKIQLFNKELKAKIEADELHSNHEIYKFAFESGVLPKHANKVIAELKKEGKIERGFKTTNLNIHNVELSLIK